MDNVGDADAASSYTEFYVSTDTSLSADDQFFAYCFPFTLAAGAQYFCSFSATFQPNGGLSPGTYYVLAVADDGRQVVERNEANNVRATASPITVN
jgi:subtilase family serine protease